MTGIKNQFDYEMNDPAKIKAKFVIIYYPNVLIQLQRMVRLSQLDVKNLAFCTLLHYATSIG